ncbi:hypothetical protein F4815DRAFT_445184 [Daldinia loculata]|nr:hypothetical protein F4815DRAFT_445184 [Daldinia loculata]
MAVKSPAVEVLILLSVSLLVIALRFYLRTEAVGWRRLAAHDHLMILIVVAYSALIATLYFSIVHCHGLANSYMAEEERISLDPESDEYS